MFWTIVIWTLIMTIMGTGAYVIRNLMNKVEIYEDFVRTLQVELNDTLTAIKTIDLRGAFQSDDEVGTVFDGIKATILRLEDFLREE